jgi:hypothetical protein
MSWIDRVVDEALEIGRPKGFLRVQSSDNALDDMMIDLQNTTRMQGIPDISRQEAAIRFLGTILFLVGTSIFSTAQGRQLPAQTTPEHDARLNDFRAIEFRRYVVKDGERKHFAQYFDTYFPEAFQQLGAIAAGSFFERKNPNVFTWIRAFHTIDDRAVVNAEFYYGSVWNEHRDTLNNLMTDSDNVMLFCPLSPDRSLAIVPAVDPVKEPSGAHGIVVAQLFAVKKDAMERSPKTQNRRLLSIEPPEPRKRVC